MKVHRARGIVLSAAVLALAATLAGSGAGPARADTTPTPSITVQGEGVVSAAPDTAILEIGASVQAATVADARAQAASAAGAIIAAAKADGVADADVQTAQLSIQPQYDNRNGHQTLTGYQVENLVQIKVRSLDRVGQIIDDAVAAGGNATIVRGITFTIDDTTALAQQARQLAVQDAKAKADQYAAATGVGVGRPIAINEESAPSPKAAAPMAAAAPLSGAPTPVAPGTLDVRVTVTISYAIQ
ncbi:MAG TPA: SIMPL domain-containing protein [Dehalococcoidia bacterium]